jgi:hypothetical protein
VRRRGGINVSPIGTEAGTDNDVRDNDVGSNLLLASWRDESCIAFFILPAAHSERMGLRFCQVSGLSSGFRGAFCTHLLLRVLTHSLSLTHTHTYTQTHTHTGLVSSSYTHTHTHTHTYKLSTHLSELPKQSPKRCPHRRGLIQFVWWAGVFMCVYVCTCVRARAPACFAEIGSHFKRRPTWELVHVTVHATVQSPGAWSVGALRCALVEHSALPLDTAFKVNLCVVFLNN